MINYDTTFDWRLAMIRGFFGDDKYGHRDVFIDTSILQNGGGERVFFDNNLEWQSGADHFNTGRTTYRKVHFNPIGYGSTVFVKHQNDIEEAVISACNGIMQMAYRDLYKDLVHTSHSASTKTELPQDRTNVQFDVYCDKATGDEYLIAFSMADIAIAFDDKSMIIYTSSDNNVPSVSVDMSIKPIYPENIMVRKYVRR